MDRTFLGIPFTAWGILCLTVAVIYYMVWPKPKPGAQPRPAMAHIILRWFHAAVWVLLAGVCFLVSSGGTALAELLGYLALVLYIVFIVTLMLDRRGAGKARTK